MVLKLLIKPFCGCCFKLDKSSRSFVHSESDDLPSGVTIAGTFVASEMHLFAVE